MKKAMAKGVAMAALLVAVSGVSSLTSCDGGGPEGPKSSASGGGATLVGVQFGRLVDIYAYRRVDVNDPDRRSTLNRMPTLIAENVVVDPTIATQPLFDAIGQENTAADYRYAPFDVGVGHEELIILWDDRVAGERQRFEAALAAAEQGLSDLPASYRGQSIPIPVVPRNAALKLTFDSNLNLSESFFVANPAAVQLLEFRATPGVSSSVTTFRPVPVRVLPSGNVLVVDPSLIGAESTVATTNGMPASSNNTSANIRLAIPTNGQVSSRFNISPDPIVTLNGTESRGIAATIRDFRSGNPADGPAGALTDLETPMIVGDIEMGIYDIQSAADFTGDPEAQGWVLTLNKRFAQVAIRGRIPFVDGGVDAATELPTGGAGVPTQLPLRSGDTLYQNVVLGSGEVVRLRAEILQVEGVANQIGGAPALGLTPAGDDGGTNTIAHVRVASLEAGFDSSGQPVTFQADPLPLGADCKVRVHYYQDVPYTSGGFSVADEARLNQFVLFDPAQPFLDPTRNPIPRGQQIGPDQGLMVGIRFSEPMDLTVVDSHNNIVLSNDTFRTTAQGGVDQLLLEPKPAALDLVGTRMVDLDGDATAIMLLPPLGLYHENTVSESYWLHVINGDGGPKDLAGNPLDLFDRRLSPQNAFSMNFTIDPTAPDNLVASRVLRFESFDEDGTPDGSEDFFGQFTLTADGRLGGAVTQRSRQIADNQTLQSIVRYDRGECWDEAPAGLPPPPPFSVVPTTIPGGVLYQCPTFVGVQPAPPPVFVPPPPPLLFGGILEPHNPRGSRLQMTYREDDFSLGYTDPDQFNLDLEQLHWASWNAQPVKFDTFDRITIEAGHSDYRPDLLFVLTPGGMNPPTCDLECNSQLSGLQNDFAANVLDGTALQPLVRDAVYQINPNKSFSTSSGTVFTPYAEFDQSYTWRDSRLVSWDMALNRATGLGGAKQPDGVPPNQDTTAHVSSPWIDEPPLQGALPSVPDPIASGFAGSVWTMSDGDFKGTQMRDHDPIAMPLLLDFKVFPDDPQNGLATGANKFHIGYVGPCWIFGAPGGYYNFGSLVCGPPGVDYPTLRVHTSGGVTGQGVEQLIDPANTTTATGGWIFDAGLGDPEGRWQSKPHNITGAYGDGHLHWAAADFVRKVSLVTFGFFDSQIPNQHDLDSATFPTSWPGLGNKRGTPDFETLGGGRGVGYGVQDLVLLQDPPLAEQPGGTSVAVEVRGAGGFDRSNQIWDRVDPATNNRYDQRGNLLNPLYACEAYRYAMPNSPGGTNVSRVNATGLTPYVLEKELDQIRNSNGHLPRFMNVRITFENDVESVPAQSPSLRSLVIAYRMTQQ